MRADNSRHVVEAARRRGQLTRSKAVQALRAMDAAGEPITFETVAQRAQVSKSWLYAQPDLQSRDREPARDAPPSPGLSDPGTPAQLRRLPTPAAGSRQRPPASARRREPDASRAARPGPR